MPFNDNPKDSTEDGEKEEILCPDCGKPMVLKNSKYGKFYGCSGYPECNKILRLNEVKKLKNADSSENHSEEVMENTIFYNGSNFDNEINNAEKELLDNKENLSTENKTEYEDIICENCGAKMVVKNGRYGEFYACPNYPKCKNIIPIKKKKN